MNRRDLIKAIETGDLTRVNLWLNQPKVDIDAPLACKQKSALLHAADRGQPAIVKLLLERGADIDQVDTEHGQTASHLAAWTGKVDVLAVLQAHGADWSVINHLGLSPLDYAVMVGVEVSVVWLVRAGAPFVYRFAKQRAASISVAVLQAMLDRGMSNSLRKLPVLHEVIGKKSLNIPLFCMLVAVCQVDVDRRDLRDRTALYTAVSDNPLLGVNLCWPPAPTPTPRAKPIRSLSKQCNTMSESARSCAGCRKFERSSPAAAISTRCSRF